MCNKRTTFRRAGFTPGYARTGLHVKRRQVTAQLTSISNLLKPLPPAAPSEMVALRPCLLACLLLATFAPFANSRANVQAPVDDEFEDDVEEAEYEDADDQEHDVEGREKRSLHLIPPILAAKVAGAALLGPPILAVKAVKLVGAGLIGAKVLKKFKTKNKVAKAARRVVSKAAPRKVIARAPQKKCHTIWEEKTSPKCHTTYGQVTFVLLFLI
jgi:hypothetical protein